MHYALDGISGHQYVEHSEGFLNIEDNTVTSPLHLPVFSLIGGNPQNPPAELPLRIYQTMVEHEQVYIPV